MKQVEVLRKQIQYYSYIFSVIVLLVLGQTIGNNGLAYLAIALETIGLFTVLVGENVADSFGRMIRFRRKRSQYYNVVNLKKCVFFLELVVGAICFLLLLFLADVIAAKIFGVPNAAFIIRVLSPVILLRMFVTLLTGYFQSFGAHIPVAVTCVLRQVLFLVLGRSFCFKLYDYGVNVAALLKNDDFKGMYAAVGLALAMVITEVVIFTGLLIFYFLSDPSYDRRRCNNGLQKTEDLRANILNFTQVNAKGIGIAFVKRLFPLLALIALVQLEDMGMYYGKYLLICSIPMLLIGARYYLLYARLNSVIKTKDNRAIRENISIGIQYAWCIGILATVLLAVLAPQLVQAFFDGDTVLTTILQHGSILIVATSVLSYLVVVHVAHNRHLTWFLTLLGTAVVFVLLCLLMGGRLESAVLAIVYAGEIALIVGAVVLCILTMSQYRVQLEYIPIFVLPLICVGVAGVIVLLLCNLLAPHIGNDVCLWLGLLLGSVLYLVFLGVCRVFSENEIDQLYGKYGKMLLSVIFK